MLCLSAKFVQTNVLYVKWKIIRNLHGYKLPGDHKNWLIQSVSKHCFHKLFAKNLNVFLFLSDFNNLKKIVQSRLIFEKRKFIVNCYLKLENYFERFKIRISYLSPYATCIKIRATNKCLYKFQISETIKNIHGQCFRIPMLSTNTINQ